MRVQDGTVQVTNGSANIDATGNTSFITAGVQVGDIISLRTVTNEANRKHLKITAVVDLNTVQTDNTVWINESGITYAIIESWLTASTSKRRYGHLCDQNTGKFSDNSVGKKLL